VAGNGRAAPGGFGAGGGGGLIVARGRYRNGKKADSRFRTCGATGAGLMWLTDGGRGPKLKGPNWLRKKKKEFSAAAGFRLAQRDGPIGGFWGSNARRGRGGTGRPALDWDVEAVGNWRPLGGVLIVWRGKRGGWGGEGGGQGEGPQTTHTQPTHPPHPTPHHPRGGKSNNVGAG